MRTDNLTVCTNQTEQQTRQMMLQVCSQLDAHGLSSAGLCSMACRWARSGANGVLTTPASPAHPPDTWHPDAIIWHELSVAPVVAQPWPGQPAPVAEANNEAWLGIYRGLLNEYPSVQAILLLTPPYAAAMACIPRVQQEGLAPIHPALAAFGPGGVPCAPFIATGTAALDQLALDALMPALASCQACLLANLGMLVMGDSIRQAYSRARCLEGLARISSLAFQMGEPAALDADQINLGVDTWKHPV